MRGEPTLLGDVRREIDVRRREQNVRAVHLHPNDASRVGIVHRMDEYGARVELPGELACSLHGMIRSPGQVRGAQQPPRRRDRLLAQEVLVRAHLLRLTRCVIPAYSPSL